MSGVSQGWPARPTAEWKTSLSAVATATKASRLLPEQRPRVMTLLQLWLMQ
ncbi:hypothetical protein BHE74_00048812 [Ensete ventricosum]|nr:hypothetical protein GW17_00038760 [Ensete ventricosum]RWW45356.1 hypothetical protein BHE74_00048812 [Ensete ventricosum]